MGDFDELQSEDDIRAIMNPGNERLPNPWPVENLIRLVAVVKKMTHPFLILRYPYRQPVYERQR
jgi:hypothetical protein